MYRQGVSTYPALTRLLPRARADPDRCYSQSLGFSKTKASLFFGHAYSYSAWASWCASLCTTAWSPLRKDGGSVGRDCSESQTWTTSIYERRRLGQGIHDGIGNCLDGSHKRLDPIARMRKRGISVADASRRPVISRTPGVHTNQSRSMASASAAWTAQNEQGGVGWLCSIDEQGACDTGG